MYSCPKCGDRLVGDGYTLVIHCPNADEASVEGKECDANPVYCSEDYASEDVKDDLFAVDRFTKDFTRGAIASLRHLRKSDKEIAEHLQSHPVIKALTMGREAMIAEQFPDSAVSAIDFALSDSDGIEFLECWNSGDFESIRREWPEAPKSVFIGADPLYIPEVPYED